MESALVPGPCLHLSAKHLPRLALCDGGIIIFRGLRRDDAARKRGWRHLNFPDGATSSTPSAPRGRAAAGPSPQPQSGGRRKRLSGGGGAAGLAPQNGAGKRQKHEDTAAAAAPPPSSSALTAPRVKSSLVADNIAAASKYKGVTFQKLAGALLCALCIASRSCSDHVI